MDWTERAKERVAEQKVSKKPDLGEIVKCFVCKSRVGIRKAVKCTADCGRVGHRKCLEIANKAVSQCLACTAVTQLANSADKSYIKNLLQSVGLEEEEESDSLSVCSEGKLISSHQSNEVSDIEVEETVMYKVHGDEV